MRQTLGSVFTLQKWQKSPSWPHFFSKIEVFLTKTVISFELSILQQTRTHR